ncbi:MAG: hypothetical protein ACFFC6_18145, partial [Promethearchaeota archaeon]
SLRIQLLLPEGQHLFTIFVEDLVGYNQTQRYTYTIDNTPLNKPHASVASGTLLGSGPKVIRFYFEEQPALVIANWNNASINESLTIHPVSAFQSGIGGEGAYYSTETERTYYVIVDVPSAFFRTHTLTLFVQDQANNWTSYIYTYPKFPLVEFLILLCLIPVTITITIFIRKRDSIFSKIRNYRERG